MRITSWLRNRANNDPDSFELANLHVQDIRLPHERLRQSLGLSFSTRDGPSFKCVTDNIYFSSDPQCDLSVVPVDDPPEGIEDRLGHVVRIQSAESAMKIDDFAVKARVCQWS